MSLKDEFENLPGERLRRELETVPGFALRDELEVQQGAKLRAQFEEQERQANKFSGTALARAEYLPGGIDFSAIVPKFVPVPPEQRQASLFMAGLQAQAKRLEENLKEDQELLMFCWHGHEKMRVLEISMPSHNVVALHCLDGENRETHVTGHMNSVNFSFVVLTIVPPKIRIPIGFNMPTGSESKT